MGWLRKKAKQIAGAFRKVGRKLKKGLGKVAKAFGKLGPLGSIALSFILPGIGGAISSWFSGLPAGNFLVKIVNGMKGAFGVVKDGMGTVFNKVTDAIEWSMNKVGGTVGKGEVGSNFRNFVSDVTGGFIDKSSIQIEKAAVDLGLDPEAVLEAIDSGLTTREEVLGRKLTEDGFKFKDKAAQKIIDNKTLVDASQGPKERKAFLDNLSNKDLSLKEKITTSSEYKVYKPIEAVRMAGAGINANEEAFESQVAYHKALKSDYFKQQADYQLGAVEQQNYSHVGEMPMFVDFSNFNPSQNVGSQYLTYRGLGGQTASLSNINPENIGGYGFDYETFLRTQLGDRLYE